MSNLNFSNNKKVLFSIKKKADFCKAFQKKKKDKKYLFGAGKNYSTRLSHTHTQVKKETILLVLLEDQIKIR